MEPKPHPQPINRRPEPNGRLDSWKEIAAFLGCGERTVKRWGAEKGLPVHRIPGSGRGRVFAYTAELTHWLDSGGSDLAPAPDSAYLPEMEPLTPTAPVIELPPGLTSVAIRSPVYARSAWWVAATSVLLCIATLAIVVRKRAHTGSDAPVPAGAEDLYLQGRYYWNKRNPESLRTAVDYFAQAIVRDPSYARAYVGLADCYNLLREFSAMSPNAAYPKALEAARKAVHLDDRSAEAHNSLAFVSFYWNWDATLADREFKRAIALNPTYVLAHHWRANFLMALGRLSEARDEMELARNLDPASNAILADKGLLLLATRHVAESVALLKQIESQEPKFSSAHLYLAEARLATKDYPAFLAEMREALALTQDNAGLAVIAAGEKGFAAGGYRKMFESMLATQQELYAKGQLTAYDLAQSNCRLGRKAAALSYLQTSLERAEPDMVSLRADPALDSLRDEPVFRDIVRRFDLGAHR